MKKMSPSAGTKYQKLFQQVIARFNETKVPRAFYNCPSRDDFFLKSAVLVTRSCPNGDTIVIVSSPLCPLHAVFADLNL